MFFAFSVLIRLHIMVTHEELATIQKCMAEVNNQNQSAFIPKMAVDGYAVNVDLAPVKELLPCNAEA